MSHFPATEKESKSGRSSLRQSLSQTKTPQTSAVAGMTESKSSSDSAATREPSSAWGSFGDPGARIHTNVLFRQNLTAGRKDRSGAGTSGDIEMNNLTKAAKVAPDPRPLSTTTFLPQTEISALATTSAHIGAGTASITPAHPAGPAVVLSETSVIISEQARSAPRKERTAPGPTRPRNREGLNDQESRPLVGIPAFSPRKPIADAEQTNLRERHSRGLLEHPQANYIVNYINPKEPAKPSTYYVKDWAETAPAIKEWGDKQKIPARQTLLLLEGEWPSTPTDSKHHHIVALPSINIQQPILKANRTVLSPVTPIIAGAGASTVTAEATVSHLPPPRFNRPPLPPLINIKAPVQPIQTAQQNPIDITTSPPTEEDLESGAFASDQQIGLTFETVNTPEQNIQEIVAEAVERERKRTSAQLIFSAFCGTRPRKAAWVAFALMLSAAAAVVVWYFKFRDTCENSLTATTNNPNEAYPLINLLRFLTTPINNTTAITLATTCATGAALALQNIKQVNLTLPSAGTYAAIEQSFLYNQAMITQHGDSFDAVEFNVTSIQNMPCGVTQDGLVRIDAIDPKSSSDRVISATVPVRAIGTARPFNLEFTADHLALNATESQQDFYPFANNLLTLEAQHPEYSTSPTLVLNTSQDNFLFSNQAEMKALCEAQSANTNPTQQITFNDRNGVWFMTGTPEILKNLLAQTKFRAKGDTALPGSQTSSAITLGIVDPCATDPSHVDNHQISIGYRAYETALSIDDTHCADQLAITTMNSAKYNPFNCFSFLSGSRYGNYQLIFSGILSDATRNYPDAITPFNSQFNSEWIIQGNFSTIQSALAAYQEHLNPDAFPSGNSLLYRSGVNITDLHTNSSFVTRTRPLFATNPAHAYVDSGPTRITLVPGASSLAFSSQVTTGNLYDLMQKQITSSTSGLTAPRDVNIIPVGETGFICIKPMPYCQSYFTQAVSFTLPINPSGRLSQAHISSEEKGLVSGISTSRGIDLFGCNPVVLPVANFHRSNLQTTLYHFNPFDLAETRVTFASKDASRSDARACYLLKVTNPDLSFYDLSGCATGPFTVIEAFLNGTDPIVKIPSNSTAGSITTVNGTVSLTFNATGCTGEAIPSSESYVLVEMVTPDVPPSVSFSEGDNLSMQPGSTNTLSDLVTVDNGNHALQQALNITCEVNCGDPAFAPFVPLAFIFSGGSGENTASSFLFFGSPTQVAQNLSGASIAAPSYDGIDSAFPSCQALCLATYGNSTPKALTLTRLIP